MAEETCTALTHDFGDNVEPCTRPAFRAGYCAQCLPQILEQAQKRLFRHIIETRELAVHVLELAEPSSRGMLFLLIEAALIEMKKSLAEKVT